jgi:hypothetical protein
VEAGPLVRSSYHAKEQAREVEAGGPGSITQILDADLDPEVRIDAGEAAARGALVAMPPVQPKQLVQIGSL